MEIRVERGEPLKSESRQIPAATYNRMRTLLGKAPGVLFVPIRSMQFLAIVDAEEVVFVDHLRKTWVAIAWRDFHPGQRSALDAAVPMQVVHYRQDGAGLMQRLPAEFDLALATLAVREHTDADGRSARVLDFPPRAEAIPP